MQLKNVSLIDSNFFIAGTDLEDIVLRLCKSMDVPIMAGREAVYYMFKQLKNGSKNRNFRSVRFKNMGTFGITSKRKRHCKSLWKLDQVEQIEQIEQIS